MARSTLRHSMRRKVALVALAALTTVPVLPPAQAAPAGAGDQYPLKTPKANASALAPLAEALFAFDDYGRAHNGKAPADGAKRVEEIARLAPHAKAEIHKFVSALRQAKETDAFDKYVYDAASTSSRPTLVNEIRSAGGGVKVLEGADTLLDGLIADRRKALSSPADFDRVLESLGLTVALSASLRSLACGAFWFTISLGYAETHAYYSCYY